MNRQQIIISVTAIIFILMNLNNHEIAIMALTLSLATIIFLSK